MRVQAQIFDSYYQGLGKERFPEVAAQLNTLQHFLTVANNDSQRIEIIETQIAYHSFYRLVGREERNYKLALFHANKAVELAQSILDETDWSSRDLLAIAYYQRSQVWREYGNKEKAVQDIGAAMHYAKGTSNLSTCKVFTEAGTIHALAGPSGKGKAYGQSLLDRAGNLFPINEEDQYYGRFNRGFYYLRRAMAFQSAEAIQDARDADTGSVGRRTLILDIEEAKMHLQHGDHEEAARVAVQSLNTAQSIHSNLNIIRIRSLYDGLKDYTDIPEVAHLSLFYLTQ